MGRPSLSRHRKFLRLARALEELTSPGFGAPLARGFLEAIWDAAYESGEELLGDAQDVEAVAGWRGSAGALTAALCAAGGEGHAGFIEAGGESWWRDGPAGAYRVHDLWDHAPDYVQRRASREAERRAKGKTLSDVRRDAAHARWNKHPADGCTTDAAACSANGATPAPAPAPAPAPEDACVKASPSAPQVVLTLPCVGNGSGSFSVTAEQVAAWREAFPGIDVEAELRKANVWLEANPTRRKTVKGMPRFLVSWLGRAQDGSGRTATSAPRTQDFTEKNAGAYAPVSLRPGGRP